VPKSHQSGASGPSTDVAAQAPDAATADAGYGNAAAQDAVKKAMGGGHYQIKRGDTLSGIAKATYGNAALWHEIQRANPDKVHRGGNLIFAGEILDLPVIDDGKGTGSTDAGGGGTTPAPGPTLRTTDFGVFQVYPDDFVGPLPPTQDAIQIVRQATFLQYQAEAQTQTINLDIDALDEGVSFERTVVTIGGEKVAVTSKAQAQHAQRIIKTLREVYGIKVDSQAGVDAIKAQYKRVPATELDKLKTKEWEYKELVALEKALSHFAPILGNPRATSSRKGDTQEITSVSKVDQAIDKNSASGVLDHSTLGEFFSGSKNFSTFTAGTNSAVDFKDSSKQLEGTAVHEIAHGLMKNELPAFITAMDYWTDQYTKSGTAGAEAPPTDYGQTNAGEDLSESVMLYFVDPDSLKSKAAKRSAWIDGVVKSWAPKTAAPSP